METQRKREKYIYEEKVTHTKTCPCWFKSHASLLVVDMTPSPFFVLIAWSKYFAIHEKLIDSMLHLIISSLEIYFSMLELITKVLVFVFFFFMNECFCGDRCFDHVIFFFLAFLPYTLWFWFFFWLFLCFFSGFFFCFQEFCHETTFILMEIEVVACYVSVVGIPWRNQFFNADKVFVTSHLWLISLNHVSCSLSSPLM